MTFFVTCGRFSLRFIVSLVTFGRFSLRFIGIISRQQTFTFFLRGYVVIKTLIKINQRYQEVRNWKSSKNQEDCCLLFLNISSSSKVIEV